jgi:uncharacterized protein (TIGR00251 family)
MVHARPGAARSALIGTHGDALAVRLAARAVEGAANEELLRVLARCLQIRPSALVIEHGERGRQKRIRVPGLTPDAAWSRLSRHLCVDKPGPGA